MYIFLWDLPLPYFISYSPTSYPPDIDEGRYGFTAGSMTMVKCMRWPEKILINRPFVYSIKSKNTFFTKR